MVQEKSSEFMWQMANYSVDFIKMEHVPRPFVPAFFRIRNIEMNGLYKLTHAIWDRGGVNDGENGAKLLLNNETN